MNDTTNPPVKRCSKCGELKPFEMFSKGKAKDGLQSICKNCVSLYNRQNKDKHTLQKREYRATLIAREVIETPLFKQCGKCKVVKSSHDFYMNRGVLDGLSLRCKQCCDIHEKTMKEERDAARHKRKAVRKSNPRAPLHEKLCPKCKTIKLAVEFCISRTSASGLTSSCKLCLLHYREINRSKLRADSRKWSRANPRRYAASIANWRKSNPIKVSASANRYRGKKLAIGGTSTHKDIANMHAIQQGHCCYCGRLGQVLHIEHIIPVTRQGSSNDPWNLALACRKCNSSKNNRLLEEWIDRWYLPTIY